MNIIERVLNDKKGKQVAVLELVETADTVEYEGKVYRRKKKDGEFISEDFFETDEPVRFSGLSRPPTF